jgi:hypothetical protein
MSKFAAASVWLAIPVAGRDEAQADASSYCFTNFSTFPLSRPR